MHVRDVVSALVRLIEHPGAVGQVFNLGSQEEVTIEEVAKRVIKLSASRSKIEYIPYEQAYEEGYEDMPRRVPDTTKVRALVGFEPSMNLDEIIQSVLSSQRPVAAPPSQPAHQQPAAPKRRRERAVAKAGVR
jgi:UDP-glucose 4-epimerase